MIVKQERKLSNVVDKFYCSIDGENKNSNKKLSDNDIKKLSRLNIINYRLNRNDES
jgi:hypothetical protein